MAPSSTVRQTTRMLKSLFGVVHLRPLPSAPRHRGMADVMRHALADAAALVKGGVDGLMVENFGDVPFHKGTVDDPVTPDVPAALAVVSNTLRERFDLPIAINCLRNDGIAAMAAAVVAAARYVRINVFSGAYLTDQGVIEGSAARVLAFRKQLGGDVQVLADFLVKHAVPLQPIDVATGAKDLAERSGASGIVLSGARTGAPVDVAFLAKVRAAVGRFPIWLGSGLTPDNAAALWPRCDGAIVGTFVKRGGRVTAPVDVVRVRALVAALRRAGR